MYEHRHIYAVPPMCYIPVSIIQCFQIISFVMSYNCCSVHSSLRPSVTPFLRHSVPPSLRPSIPPSTPPLKPSGPTPLRPSVSHPSVNPPLLPSVPPALRPFVPLSLHPSVNPPLLPPLRPYTPSATSYQCPSSYISLRPSVPQSRSLFSSHICAAQCPFSPNFFVYIYWRARVCWPLLCLCRPFCFFERCLYSHPESRLSKEALPT
jgi:hypothetical protein